MKKILHFLVASGLSLFAQNSPSTLGSPVLILQNDIPQKVTAALGNTISQSTELNVDPAFIDIYKKGRDMLSGHQTPKSLQKYEKNYFIIPYVVLIGESIDALRKQTFEDLNSIFPQMNTLLKERKSPHLRVIYIIRERNAGSMYPGKFIGAIDTPDLDIQLQGTPNGLATRFDISVKPIPRGYPMEARIVAVKYPIVGTSDTGKSFYKYPITSPYQKSNHTPENIASGMQYFEMKHNQIENLFFSNPPSWFAEGIEDGERRIFLGETYRLMARALSLVENMDPSIYARIDPLERQRLMKSQIEESYVQLAMNKESSYQRDSRADAKGWMQFIPTTWRNFSQKYPSPHVIQDFSAGAIDHASSILMSYAHFEEERRVYEGYPLVKEWMYNEGKKYLPHLLAAGYNSNVSDSTYRDKETGVVVTVAGRARQLSDILQSHKIQTPDIIMKIFMESFPHKNPEETRWYLKKLEGVLQEVFHRGPALH